jgi:hypothetical protein
VLNLAQKINFVMQKSRHGDAKETVGKSFSKSTNIMNFSMILLTLKVHLLAHISLSNFQS